MILILLLFQSCNNGDSYNNNLGDHAELGFELDEPNTILNELAKGELKNDINSILLVLYGNTERKWEFEYIPNTDLISKMTYFSPHYQTCEKDEYVFSYNSLNLVSKIVSTRRNVCNEFTVIHEYSFNYNQNGLLKSIFTDNQIFVEENYFGYYPNGKIKEIYNCFRQRGENATFGLQKFKYDVLFKNVIQIEHIFGSNYHYIYEYSYDNKINPFKDVFVAVSVFMPFIGPAYLSENNVISETRKLGNIENSNGIIREFQFNYSANNTLFDYKYLNNERVFKINQ